MKDFFMFLVIGFLMAVLFSSGQVENPDTHLRLTQTRILLESGSFKLTQDVGEDSHGNIAINTLGERCMVYNPGQSLVLVPIYFASKLLTNNDVGAYYLAAFFTSFLNYIVNAICAYFLFRIVLMLGYNRKKSFITSLIFCFTSYAFVFAQSTYEHHFEMLFILVALFFSLHRGLKYNYLYAGLIISIGLVFRSTTILLVPTILLLLQVNRERLVFLIGTVPGVLVLLFYNYYRFQNPMETGYSIAWAHTHGKEMVLWSITGVPKAIIGLFLSPGKGLLFFSPTIILVVFYAKQFFLKHKRFSLSVLIFIVTYVFLFSMNFAWGGSIWSFGPRYILPIIPLVYLVLSEIRPSKWLYPSMIVAFSLQTVLISVNYKRAVLEQYVNHDGLDEESYIFELANIPLYTQSKQLVKIVPKNFNEDLINYQPNSPWKKEMRLGSNQDVLFNSIEKNSINFWWVRVFHWNPSLGYQILTILIIITAIFFSIKTYRYVRENLQ